jgi:hypothetical protein
MGNREKPLADLIKHGDKVTIVSSTGQKITGRAVMFNPDIKAWVLNIGGGYGTPALADLSNVIKVVEEKGKK